MTAVIRRSPSARPTPSELAAAAEALRPYLSEHALEAEEERDLPVATVAALKAAGLHKIYIPARFGGYEMDMGAHYEPSRIIGRSCGAAAWLTSLVFSNTSGAARLHPEAQEEFFGSNPDAVLAGGSAGGGLLTKEGDRWRLKGRWSFVSGVSHATGVKVTAKSDPGQPISHFVLLMPGDYDILRTWNSEGLRGTGSHDIVVNDVELAPHRVIPLMELISPNPPGSALHHSYVYRMRAAPFQKTWFCGPLQGTAEGAYESYLDQTKARAGRLFGESIRDQTPVQIRVGEAQAKLDAAEAVVLRVLSLLHERGSAGLDIAGEDMLFVKRSVTYAASLCAETAEALARAMGVTGQVRTNPVQRLFRDSRAISTHIELNWDHSMTATGKRRLGLLTGDPLIDGEVGDGPLTLLGTQI